MKKGISPMLGLILVMFLSVISVISLQTWLESTQSSFIGDIEENNNNNNLVDKKYISIYGGSMYLGNTDDVQINNIKINGLNCRISGVYENYDEIELRNCISGFLGENILIEITTDKQIITKNIFVKKENLDIFLEITIPESQWFKSQWDTTNSGFSLDYQIRLPLREHGNYSFIVDWGDGNRDNITNWNQSEITHSYSKLGVYNITLAGRVDGFGFNGEKNVFDNSVDDGDKLLDISQWGTLSLGNSGNSSFIEGGNFMGAENFQISASESPDLSKTTSLSKTFRGATTFNSNISSWNTSLITNMSSLFENATSFNQSIVLWDVSLVKNMDYLFFNASSFNQNISLWNVNNVTNCLSFGKGSLLTLSNSPNFDYETCDPFFVDADPPEVDLGI